MRSVPLQPGRLKNGIVSLKKCKMLALEHRYFYLALLQEKKGEGRREEKGASEGSGGKRIWIFLELSSFSQAPSLNILLSQKDPQPSDQI